MIELNYGKEVYKISNKSSEINLNKFQEVQNYLSGDNLFFFDSWLNIIEILSDKRGIKQKIGEEDFFKIVEHLHLKDFGDISGEIIIDNIKYTANIKNDKPSLTAYQFSEIEKLVKKYPSDYITKTMCIIFNTENEEDNVFKKKAEVFGEKMTIDIALPYLAKAHKTILDNLKKIAEVSNEK